MGEELPQDPSYPSEGIVGEEVDKKLPQDPTWGRSGEEVDKKLPQDPTWGRSGEEVDKKLPQDPSYPSWGIQFGAEEAGVWCEGDKSVMFIEEPSFMVLVGEKRTKKSEDLTIFYITTNLR